jgi:DNA mismatch repair protein MutS2
MMKHFDDQSVLDLEFDMIRLLLHDYCTSDSGRMMVAELNPIWNSKELTDELIRTKEFHRVRTEGFSFPRIEFEELHIELEMLGVAGSMLGEPGFYKILRASVLVNEIVLFFEKESTNFELLPGALQNVFYTLDIINPIEKVFDEKGNIRDNASPALNEIRSDIERVRRQINRNFNRTLKDYKAKGWLADTNEGYISERRVLSVVSTYKREIKGQVIGTSKTGNWTFIEPEVNVPLNYELGQLIDDEQREIRRILTELTATLSGHKDLISAYQKVLVTFDVLNAKVRFALDINADLPGISQEMNIDLIEAYHPLLLLANQKEGLKTHPQNLKMDKFSRMLVISGPNAGGKSITLKTVGLLQVMFQSGLLVPISPASTMCFFQMILTDIGDHQSIENQLSTYSYRLKRMKHFLEVANRRALLLLDEFGTGSDPELGGALAEVFFENLYNKKAFGVVTTHYANIKTKASELKNAVNACMLFNEDTLEPLYKLSVGQPGSSFTFEVAENIGIDKKLLEDAKSKLDSRKVKLDKIIGELQREKTKIETINHKLEKAESDARNSKELFDKKKEKYDDRLKSQQELIEQNNFIISKGKKLQQFIKRYNPSQSNKKLLKEIREYLTVEKTREIDSTKKARVKEKVNKKRTESKARRAHMEKIAVGCTVKLRGGRENGKVLEIDGKDALVAFGVFKSRVDMTKLDYVSG